MKAEIVASTHERLKQAFSNTSLKQADLVRLTGIDKSSISLYLSGKITPKGDKLYKLALALGVSPVWLSGFNVPMIDNYNKNKSSTFWDKLRTICNEKNLDVTNVIETVGLDRSTINSWKNGISPNYETMLAIARYLGVPINVFLDDSESFSSKVADSVSYKYKEAHSADEQVLLNNYQALNPKGREKLLDYSDDLVSNGKYTEK